MYFLVVNFHYIHEEGRFPYPSIYPTTVMRLKNQLKELGRFFEFIGQGDLLQAIDGEADLPDRCCLITFDDGLQSQYENALPLLDVLGIPAIFFVNAIPYAEGRACLVHKIHYTRAYLSPDVFCDKVAEKYVSLTGKKFDLDILVDKTRVQRQYMYDNGVNAQIKFILNNLLDDLTRERIIDEIFLEIVNDEADFCSRFYLQPEQLSDLAARSYLGIHSYSHYPLSKYPTVNLMKTNVKKNLKVINGFINSSNPIYGISYPYGGSEAVSIEVAKASRECGLKFGLTMERAFNRTLQYPLLFARIDTNDAPGGKYPLFAYSSGELRVDKDRFKARRMIYFQEDV